MTTIHEWLTMENQRLEESRQHTDDKESLKFVEGSIVEFEIDFANPFDKWVDPVDEQVIKKIIPVVHEGIKKNLWLNVKNPLYRDLIREGVTGNNKFKVLQTGTQAKTRYTLIKD